jgi:hypothetical protein
VSPCHGGRNQSVQAALKDAVCLQVRSACSPDAESYMLVREPAMCRYIVTLYHPAICQDKKYAIRVVEAPSSPVPAKDAREEL